MRSGTWALLVLALAASRGAAAYDGGGGEMGLHTATSLGPRAAFFALDDADSGAWGSGAQMRLHLSSAYSLELSGDFVHYSSRGTGVAATPVQATAVGYFDPESSLSPYLLIGGGWYPAHAAGPYAAERLFGPHVGAGLELLLGGSWSLDGSYRYLWTEIVSWTRPVRVVGTDFAQRGHMFTVALNCRL